MKISYLGIKASIAVLIGVILISYMVYWKSISTLSDHMTSLIMVSNHLQNGEMFHSAVHSMMIEANREPINSQYAKNRLKADNTLFQLRSYLDDMSDGMEKKMLSETTDRLSKYYAIFRQYTEKMTLQKDTGHDTTDEKSVQRLFDDIFKEYKQLHQHHSQQRDHLLSQTQSIRKSTQLMLVIQIIFSIIAGFLVIVYLDRVVLKLFSLTEKLALHDKLTGLYNRHGLDRIISELEKPGGKVRNDRYGIILIDIDHFKRFNDTYGHTGGDQLLVRLAEVLLKTVRTQDRIVRFGDLSFQDGYLWNQRGGSKNMQYRRRDSLRSLGRHGAKTGHDQRWLCGQRP